MAFLFLLLRQSVAADNQLLLTVNNVTFLSKITYPFLGNKYFYGHLFSCSHISCIKVMVTDHGRDSLKLWFSSKYSDT